MPITLRGLAAFLLAFGVAASASAANREHEQLAADIRMLQQQTQQLQNLIGTLGETLKAVNARLDEESGAMHKAFADQKLLIDALTTDLRVVREKVDDNNVRVASLAQELDALRQGVEQLQSPPRPSPTEPDATAPSPGAAVPGTPAPAGGAAPTAAAGSNAPSAGVTTPSAQAPPPRVPVGASPQQTFDMAWSDYTQGLWDLAVQGFQDYLSSFPKSPQAVDAQVMIGDSYLNGNKYDKAVEAYDLAIRTYPGANNAAIPNAYYHKGLALRHLGQVDRAREAFEYLVKTYPDSDAGRLARQALDTDKR